MSSHYEAEVAWQRGGQAFLDNRYSRRHGIRFDGGADVPGSSSPHVVPVPMSDPAGVDPEEMFVASIASCHMLWFLSLAAKKRFRVDHYHDHALGEMAKNADGKLVVARVRLRPEVAFSGERIPTHADIDALHHAAHEECYIANSVRTEITVEPAFVD
jgi:organic hydroperoxide reductase OsmC/OhrA